MEKTYNLLVFASQLMNVLADRFFRADFFEVLFFVGSLVILLFSLTVYLIIGGRYLCKNIFLLKVY
jgi:hypothetical protein